MKKACPERAKPFSHKVEDYFAIEFFSIHISIIRFSIRSRLIF